MNAPDTFTSRSNDQNAPTGSDIVSMIQNLWFDEHQQQEGASSNFEQRSPDVDRGQSHGAQQALSVDDLYMSHYFPCQPTSSSSTGDLASINNGSKRDIESRPHSSQFGLMTGGVPSPPGLSVASGFSPLPHHEQASSRFVGGSSLLNQNLENLLKTFTQNSGNCFAVPEISSPSSTDAYQSFHQSSFQTNNNITGSKGPNGSNSGHFMASAAAVTSNILTGDTKHLLSHQLSSPQSSSIHHQQLAKSGPTALGSMEQSNCSGSKINFKQQHPAAVQQQQLSSVVPDLKSSPHQQQQLRTNHSTTGTPYLSNPSEFAAILNNQSPMVPITPPHGSGGSVSSPNNGGSLLGGPSSTSSSSLLDPIFGSSAMVMLDDRLSSPFGTMGESFLHRHSKSGLAAMGQSERFESQMNLISNEIQSTIQMYVNGLNSRKDHLIQQLETIRKIYSAIFVLQSKSESSGAIGPPSPGGHLSIPNISFTKPDVTLLKAISSIGFITVPAFAPFCTVSGDGLDVTIPGLNSSFVIHTKNCFQEELMVGHESVNVRIVAISEPKNGSLDHTSQHGQTSSSHGLPPSSYSSAVASSETTHSSLSPPILNEALTRSVSITDHNNGKYTVLYSVPVSKAIPSQIEIHVVINGLAVQGSPFRVKVMKQNKTSSWSRAMNYGTEGNAIGQLCRPWGVAIARMPHGLIQSGLVHNENTHSNSTFLVAVADRSNNRVQLFNLDMISKQMIAFQVFGSGPGTRDGQFDRPAGICFNLQLGRVIVADKDNHRVQVFDLEGKFLLKFGEKGNRVGQFCYPWDVDSCPITHEIAVSDTRNRRVQLFDSSGRYLSYFAQPLDSPRGVSFLADSKILVSDFNKHRLLIFDRKNHGQHPKHLHSSAPSTPTPPPGAVPAGTVSQSSTRFIGFGEGSGWGEFLRPQGTSVCGNFIFCSDSRNNRVCIYNFATQSFEYLMEELNLDRPSGIAVLDNVMIVTDFGNNRLQIFQQH